MTAGLALLAFLLFAITLVLLLLVRREDHPRGRHAGVAAQAADLRVR